MYTASNPGLDAVKTALLAQFRADEFLLAQESDMVWVYREAGWVFRVRRRMANDLQVFRIPMLHEAPLSYEFLTRLKNMLPEALHPGKMCVVTQLSILGRLSRRQVPQARRRRHQLQKTNM